MGVVESFFEEVIGVKIKSQNFFYTYDPSKIWSVNPKNENFPLMPLLIYKKIFFSGLPNYFWLVCNRTKNPQTFFAPATPSKKWALSVTAINDFQFTSKIWNGRGLPRPYGQV